LDQLLYQVEMEQLIQEAEQVVEIVKQVVKESL
jgi:hypothetical protein